MICFCILTVPEVMSFRPYDEFDRFVHVQHQENSISGGELGGELVCSIILCTKS